MIFKKQKPVVHPVPSEAALSRLINENDELRRAADKALAELEQIKKEAAELRADNAGLDSSLQDMTSRAETAEMQAVALDKIAREARGSLETARRDHELLQKLENPRVLAKYAGRGKEWFLYWTVEIGGKNWGAYPTQTLASQAARVAERMGLGPGSVKEAGLMIIGVCPLCGEEIRSSPHGEDSTESFGRLYHTACLATWDRTLQDAKAKHEGVKA